MMARARAFDSSGDGAHPSNAWLLKAAFWVLSAGSVIKIPDAAAKTGLKSTAPDAVQ
jgi:hypothetical protein